VRNIVVFALILISSILSSQTFTEIEAGLHGIEFSSVDWGDYDNDGDLDILLSGQDNSHIGITKIYRNDSGNFTDINAGLIGLKHASCTWGDYDNDGNLDILMSGLNNSSAGITKIYRNDSGSFTDINAGLVGLSLYPACAWGDYDNDGDIDILLVGSYISRIYQNDSGSFTDINAGLIGLCDALCDWGDYDNDGDLDIIISGRDNTSNGIVKIYRNDSGSFTDINADLHDAETGSVLWSDFNNDGYLDILITGYNRTNDIPISIIYKNIAGNFIESNAGLLGLDYSYACAGDYDNDGDTDIIITGTNDWSNPISIIYNNNLDSFEIDTTITGVQIGCVEWGDYDSDGDLDILLSGDDDSNPITKIFRNDSISANSIPNTPTGLNAFIDSTSVNLIWSKATDFETPQDGLSYNFYVGTESGKSDIMSPMSDISTGCRKIVNIGNAQKNTTWAIKNLESGTYYWSVQAIDQGYSGSVFADEQCFTIGSLISPCNVKTNLSGNNITITWPEVFGATSYKVYASDDPYLEFIDVSAEGTFNGCNWSAQTDIYRMRFYYVVAVDTKK